MEEHPQVRNNHKKQPPPLTVNQRRRRSTALPPRCSWLRLLRLCVRLIQPLGSVQSVSSNVGNGPLLPRVQAQNRPGSCRRWLLLCSPFSPGGRGAPSPTSPRARPLLTEWATRTFTSLGAETAAPTHPLAPPRGDRRAPGTGGSWHLGSWPLQCRAMPSGRRP